MIPLLVSKCTTKTGHKKDDEDSSNALQEGFSVDYVFWARIWRCMRIGTGTPFTNSKVWLLILFNISCQIYAGVVAQNLFYYTGTGTSKADPGMAGCLKSDSCTRATYERYLVKFAWTFVILVMGVTGYSVSGDILNVLIRRRLGLKLQNRLFQGNTLYRIQLDGRLDNFDQRITTDLQVLLDGLCCVFFGNTSDYIAYPIGFVLTRMICAFNNTFNPPGQSFVLSSDKRLEILFAVIAMALVTFLAYLGPMNMISKAVFKSQQFEGNFRTTHTRAIVHSESISMYNGEARERVHADEQYAKVHQNNIRYYVIQSILMFLRVTVTIIQPAVGMMLLSVTGATDNSYASAFLKQLGNVLEFGLDIPSLIARLAFASGASHRVGQLLEAIDVFQMHEPENANVIVAEKPPKVQYNMHHGVEMSEITITDPLHASPQDVDYIKLDSVCAAPPLPEFDIVTTKSPFSNCKKGNKHHKYGSKPNLFTNLSLHIRRGDSTVIIGKSGCGKSSLLRVIAGLWKINDGKVERPCKIGRDGMFFLPQRSYVFPGSLLEQITYPDAPKNTDEENNTIVKLLEEVYLHHLLENYDLTTHVDWTAALAASERQQLSFARMFYHCPMFCLADEATCALSLELEYHLLSLCEEKEITLISVAHRPSVFPHHKYLLRFDVDSKSWIQSELGPEVQDELKGIKRQMGENPFSRRSAPPEPDHHKTEGFNFQFFKKLAVMLKMLFEGGVFSFGTLLCSVMFICAGLSAMLQIIVFLYYKTDSIIADILLGLTTSPFNRAGIIVGINIVSAFLQAASAFSGAMLAVHMQQAVVKKIHSLYFDKKVVYKLNNIDKLDGIDQRVVADMSGVRESMSWLFGNPFSFLNYRLGLFPLAITFAIMIGYAFSVSWALILFFLLSLILAGVIQLLASKVTSRAVERRADAEGRLRSHLGRVKLAIESITFFQGQQEELLKLNELMEEVSKERMAYAIRAGMVVWPTVVMYYWLSNGDYAMATILQVYLPRFKVDKAVIFTLVSYCVLLGKLGNQLIMSTGGLGMLAGYTDRVHALLEKTDRVNKAASNDSNCIVPSQDHISIKNGSIIIGKESEFNKPLIENLNLSLQKGDSMIVMGPSASGKSSISRVLAGLWPLRTGEAHTLINRGHGGIFFIPQTNYATEGSLKQQITYPDEHSEAGDVELQSILEEVGLGYIGERWGFSKVVDWDAVLSGGEAQRLGMARAFYHNPSFLVMDEATSALDMALEKKCMQAVISHVHSYCSIASRLSLIPYHHRLLQMDGKSGYTITECGDKNVSHGPQSAPMEPSAIIAPNLEFIVPVPQQAALPHPSEYAYDNNNA